MLIASLTGRHAAVFRVHSVEKNTGSTDPFRKCHARDPAPAKAFAFRRSLAPGEALDTATLTTLSSRNGIREITFRHTSSGIRNSLVLELSTHVLQCHPLA